MASGFYCVKLLQGRTEQICCRYTTLISAASTFELGVLSYGRIILSIGLESVFINTYIHHCQPNDTTQNYIQQNLSGSVSLVNQFFWQHVTRTLVIRTIMWSIVV